ncbi:hypothetical protein HNQ85_002677 [Anoxybacillus calidus]|jgi:hypothetical protein|uniref:DUF3892 domain-containing protein n=1 Tax=[Anoxybacillus] calidus TaxID=575178 RepID=A0A7V9Z1U3_9BACL|nr:DUF3892 domain-containing protein [Anoxybacillus calidus]MBA2872368.1 hypothetical protein [Anoxybacillus calidus]
MGQQETFVAVQKNHEGDIINFKTSSGRVLSYRKALMEIENGAITGVNIFTGKDGEHYIRSNADGVQANNLDNLPTFF